MNDLENIQTLAVVVYIVIVL